MAKTSINGRLDSGTKYSSIITFKEVFPETKGKIDFSLNRGFTKPEFRKKSISKNSLMENKSQQLLPVYIFIQI